MGSISMALDRRVTFFKTHEFNIEVIALVHFLHVECWQRADRVFRS
jgi:hypothetical protein